MSLHVIFQLLCLLESGPTYITGELLVFGVCPPDMAVVGRVRGERFPAVFTLERPLTGVLANVCAKDAGGRERLVTVNTFVRPLSRVHAHVFVQTGGLRETFAAHGALMWPVFLVHMENVNSKTISLLERSVAEVAREFSVALIHTARVFQMFVSIVLIGEHFSTTITLETLSRIFCRESFTVINELFEGERNTQKLHIAISVPNQQLLAGSDLFAGLIIYLSVTLHRNQVLLFRKARALHQGHPIPWSASSIHKMTQAAVLKDLPHECVVVIGLDLTCVYQFALKGSKPGAFWNCAFISESSIMGKASTSSLENRYAFREFKSFDINRENLAISCAGRK